MNSPIDQATDTKITTTNSFYSHYYRQSRQCSTTGCGI